jgi:hypothetical protein
LPGSGKIGAVLTITLDTNTLPVEKALAGLGNLEVDVATTTVTTREIEGTTLAGGIKNLKIIRETGVWGESRWGEAVYSDKSDGVRYEELLTFLSSGSFPKPGQRDSLSAGQERIKRDAMILSAHARERREIFVSDDVKAIGQAGSDRRRQLEERFGIRAMTVAEFRAFATVR